MDWADEIAEQLLDFWNWQAEKGLARDMQGNIAAALRDAVTAERERCVKIADNFDFGFWDRREHDFMVREAIAAKIRSVQPQNSPSIGKTGEETI